MSRLPVQSVESATGSNKDIFNAFQKALGTVPNLVKVMANSPNVLQGYAQFNGALSGGKLSPKIREQIALLTAESNACSYCLSAHSVLGKMVGLNQAQVDAARSAQSDDPKTAAALNFAQAIIDTRGNVGPSAVTKVRAAGFSDAEIAEILAHVALNYFTNFFNVAFDVEVDFPKVEPRSLVSAR